MKTVRVDLCRRMERESKGHQEWKRATPSARCRRSARKRQRGSRRTPRRQLRVTLRMRGETKDLAADAREKEEEQCRRLAEYQATSKSVSQART